MEYLMNLSRTLAPGKKSVNIMDWQAGRVDVRITCSKVSLLT